MTTRPLRLLYVMDPLANVAIDKDTTFAFMLEGQRRGHRQSYCLLDDLYVDRTVPGARAHAIQVQRAADHYSPGEATTAPLVDWDIIFMRKDPPFDMRFFFATHVLGLADPARTLVVNDPRGLRDANEKLYALHFPDVIPESCVTSSHARLKAFMAELGGEMIVKPLDGCGGAGVFHVHQNDRNLNSILELSTADGTRLVMAQRYLPAAREGDKRIIVLEGEPLGAILRIPREDDTRGNIHVGGRVEPAPITPRDREICQRLKPRFAADGLYFVGLDVIGGLVTEINVTSPTGVQEIDRLDGVCLESQVFDAVERRAAGLTRRGAQ
jgi:glutathione synthase